MNRGYAVTIKETSRELTPKERVAIKDTGSCIRLDEATKEQSVKIFPSLFAVLGIHNEKSDDKDYENYIIVDRDGVKYVTGSQSFWNSFMEISEEMEGEAEEWGIEAYRLPSKNYKGKDFLTCSII